MKYRRLRRAGAFVAAAILLLAIVQGMAEALPGPDLLDFGSFLASGRAAARGDNPYGIYPETFHVVLPGFESWNPNLNPPVALPLFQWFARFDPHDGFRMWWALSFVCQAALVWMLEARYRRGVVAVLWAFALAGFWDTLVLGQIYAPLALAATGAWLLEDRGRPIAAGLLIGVVAAVKPNFLVWPALLLLSGHHRSALAAIAAAAVLSALPLALYGPEVYLQWAGLIANDEARGVFLTNASLAGIAQRLGWPEGGRVLGVALLAGLGLWAWRCRPRPLEAAAVALAAGLLASPLAWIHYTLFLVPVIMATRLTPALGLSAALMVVPVPAVLALLDSPAWVKASLGSVYGWAVTLCLVALMAGRPAR